MADEGKRQSEGATEKWIKYYSSNHQILLVGEGDFSFSLCLAYSFASASNIVASSLDSYDDVTKKYKKAKSNLENLEKLEACLLHGVDATKMKLHPDLRKQTFDRVIFNFPHAGFHGKEDNPSLIKKHRALLNGFFTNARELLRAGGEVHVNHKTGAPYSNWNLENLASQSSLSLIECVDFKKKDYPGYNNKRGDGLKCDQSFRLGKCCTFKFIYNPRAIGEQMMGKHIQQRNSPRQEGQVLQWPTPVGLNYSPLTSQIPKMNAGWPLATSSRNEHYQIFGGNPDSVLKIPSITPDGSYFGHRMSVDFQRPMQPLTSYLGNDRVGHMIPPSLTTRKEPFQNVGSISRHMEVERASLEEILGSTSRNSYYSSNGVWFDFETFSADVPVTGRTLNGEIYVRRVLQRLDDLRSRARNMLRGPEYR